VVRAGIVLVVFVAVTVLVLAEIHPSASAPASGATPVASSTSTTSTTAPASGTATTATTTRPAHGTHGRHTTTTTTVPPSHVPVLVANASGVTGAAAAVSARLAAAGWETLPPVDASTDVPTSFVYYLAGYRTEAITVAATLNLPIGVVKPYTTAAPISSIGNAAVVVAAGPDLATPAATTATTAG
jgi:hypothetical protein